MNVLQVELEDIDLHRLSRSLIKEGNPIPSVCLSTANSFAGAPAEQTGLSWGVCWSAR